MTNETHVTIGISGMDKSILFYKSIGFVEIVRWENHYAKLQMNGLKIGLHPTSEENLHSNSGNLSIGMQVHEMGEAKHLLETLSVPFRERSEEGGSFVHFTDPDGNSLYFIKPRW